MFFKLLNDKDVEFCLKHLPKNKTYEDGKNTGVNKQNTESNSVPDEVKKLISSRFYDSFYIDSVYCPNRVSVNFYNKYQKDDYYNIHVDAFKAMPKSNNVFFDYGFSINLNDNYEGGSFLLRTDVGPVSKQLKSGEAAIFPIIYPHGVAPVTSGVRENIVGWLSSNVSYEQAFILKNLYDVNVYLRDKDKDTFVESTLVQTYLKKAWGK